MSTGSTTAWCDSTGTAFRCCGARGFAPEPLALPAGFDAPVRALAAGGDLKAAFCLAGDGNALLSQHLGDLDELKNQNAWRQALGLYRGLFDTKPDLIVADRNPGYRSTQLMLLCRRW
ncbi:hypothetical protein [Mesorhizobium sp. M0195]|uniref:hypothetical protein n=1 Tax=unclassified Mesorhizobium TaxID=325217 RepID=UPI003336600A